MPAVEFYNADLRPEESSFGRQLKSASLSAFHEAVKKGASAQEDSVLSLWRVWRSPRPSPLSRGDLRRGFQPGQGAAEDFQE